MDVHENVVVVVVVVVESTAALKLGATNNTLSSMASCNRVPLVAAVALEYNPLVVKVMCRSDIIIVIIITDIEHHHDLFWNGTCLGSPARAQIVMVCGAGCNVSCGGVCVGGCWWSGHQEYGLVPRRDERCDCIASAATAGGCDSEATYYHVFVRAVINDAISDLCECCVTACVYNDVSHVHLRVVAC